VFRAAMRGFIITPDVALQGSHFCQRSLYSGMK
jgi:hypothetical protein